MAPRLRAPVLAITLAVMGAVAAGCGIAAPRGGTAASPAATPAASVPRAIDQTRLQLEGALRAGGWFLDRATVPYRPPETGRVATAPRVVYQVILPDDPGRGQVVVYEFPDTAAAAAAGRELAEYLGSGPGRVQFTPDTRHVLRQLGTTLILYTWTREGTTDAVEEIAMILDTVGQGIAIPR